MAYTWVKVDKFDIDDEWNSLYEDSKEDLNGGTVIQNPDWTEDEKKQYIIKLMNEQDVHNQYNIKIYKDDVPVMFNHCVFQDNMFLWVTGIVAKVNNSKAWTWTSEFHQANKSWIQSIGGTKFAIECIKGARIDTYFTAGTNEGICLGTLEEQDRENNMKLMIWTY